MKKVLLGLGFIAALAILVTSVNISTPTDAHAAAYSRCLGCHPARTNGVGVSMRVLANKPLSRYQMALAGKLRRMPAQPGVNPAAVRNAIRRAFK